MPVLQEIFGKFREWLASYIIAIVVAESYDSGEAAEVLIGLATAAPPAVRDCVASGLGRIRDPASRYREAIFQSLTQLSRDKNPQARMAALEALSRQRLFKDGSGRTARLRHFCGIRQNPVAAAVQRGGEPPHSCRAYDQRKPMPCTWSSVA